MWDYEMPIGNNTVVGVVYDDSRCYKLETNHLYCKNYEVIGAMAVINKRVDGVSFSIDPIVVYKTKYSNYEFKSVSILNN